MFQLRSRSGGWSHRFAWAAMRILLGCLCLKLGVGLVAEIWPWLVGLGVGTAGIIGAIWYIRYRRWYGG